MSAAACLKLIAWVAPTWPCLRDTGSKNKFVNASVHALWQYLRPLAFMCTRWTTSSLQAEGSEVALELLLVALLPLTIPYSQQGSQGTHLPFSTSALPRGLVRPQQRYLLHGASISRSSASHMC